MNENVKTFIEELKTVVMDLHRSAGNLDSMIQNLELEISESSDEYLKVYIKSMAAYRKDLRQIRFPEIEKREDDIWERLQREPLKEKES